MQTSEKQVLSEEIQYFTEASHWLQKALLETLSSEPISPTGAVLYAGIRYKCSERFWETKRIFAPCSILKNSNTS